MTICIFSTAKGRDPWRLVPLLLLPARSTASSDAASNQPVVEIGLYVALASGVLLLMAAQQIFRAARRQVWWFPCEGTLLSLNAGTLSVLAVATKLPNDLTTPMEGSIDQITKLSGSAVMCAIMAAGMPSLGNMKPEELWSNLAALGVLVVTMVVNVSMQIRSGVISSFITEHIMLLASMTLLFTLLCTLALAIPAMASDVRDSVHSKHDDKALGYDDQSVLSSWEHLSKEARTTWITVVTSDLQYVVARSPIAASTGVIMIFSVLVFSSGVVRSRILKSPKFITSYGETSVYKWTTLPISILQAVTLFLCMCPSIIRCWRAVLYSGYNFTNFRFSLEPFWQKSIVDFKFKPVAIEPADPKKRQLRRMVQIWKERLLDCFQCVELIFVQMSRVTCLAFSWLRLLQKYVTLPYLTKCGAEEPRSDTLQLYGALVCLDGENPQKLWEATRTYWAPVSMLIEKGKRAEIGKLTKLLKEHSAQDGDFLKRVRHVLAPSREGDQVKVLSWSLTIVTLLAVMISLEWEAAGTCHESQEAMDAYTQALDMVALVDKHFSVPKKPWEGATQAVWAHLEARLRWLHTDLRSLTHHGSALRKLEESAHELLPPPSSSASHLHSTSASVAAHCLIHVIESLQQLNHSDHLMQTTKALLADVLAACLTNFPVAVQLEINKASHKVHSNNLQHALYLLGKGQQLWPHLAWSQASIASSLHGSIQAWIQPL